jgi:hypothetical protein
VVLISPGGDRVDAIINFPVSDAMLAGAPLRCRFMCALAG